MGFGIEERLGQGPGELGLADAGGPQEEERSDGPRRVLEPGAGAHDGIGHGGDGIVLADDAAAKHVGEAEELLALRG
ncbi:MAG: hypothetical protein BWX69_03179 [Planctomycetes bacterium ADurb.Bin069]|nr:MAG: hypothetical protein BWX69_03179 [Planctomycetes bacterium ADurb.Bin069]